MRPVRTACWIHRVWVSRCRSLPSPWREQIPIAALLSVHTRTGAVTPKSRSRAW